MEDEESPFHPPACMLDRPHIIYNKSTKKYVCWIKVMHQRGTQDEVVLTADRWAPDCMDFEYADYAKIYDKLFTGSEEEKKQIRGSSDFLRVDDLKRETALATYVWLPLRFEKEMVYIDWYNEWSIEDMECTESEVSDGR